MKQEEIKKLIKRTEGVQKILENRLNEVSETDDYNFRNIKSIFEKIAKKVYSETKIKLEITDNDINNLLKMDPSKRLGQGVKLKQPNETVKCPNTGGSITFTYSFELVFINGKPNILFDSSISKMSGIFEHYISQDETVMLKFNENS